MAWIKVDHEFPDKAELAQMAERLGLDHDTVVGKCLRWLIWIDKNSIDGTVSTTTSHIDRLPRFLRCAPRLWLADRPLRLAFSPPLRSAQRPFREGPRAHVRPCVTLA